MNPQPIRTIFDLAEYYGLRIELIDLPLNNAGFLDSEDEFIAVNRNLPHCEQAFTVGHEICHYISDHKNPRRKYRNRVLDGQFKSPRVRRFVRYLRKFTNRILPVELEADMFAMSSMLLIGSKDDLKEFIERHPSKIWLLLYTELVFCIQHPAHFLNGIFKNLLSAQAKS